MIAEAQLFVGIAEIAGVFVAFGALISATHRDEVQPAPLGMLRAVVTIGLVVVVAALLPVALGAYGLTDHALWRMASTGFLGLEWAIMVLLFRRPENRGILRRQTRIRRGAAITFLLFEASIQVPLFLAIAGILPAREPALYLTSLAFSLFQGAFVLAQFVYSRTDRSDP